MATYVITVIGDDRVGLVQSLADVIVRAGGNWERSEMTELAGKFAGILMATVADERAEELAGHLTGLDGILDVRIHRAEPEAPAVDPEATTMTLDLVGNDRPGIVQEITSTLRRHTVTIDRFESHVADTPMAGGRLFECRAALRGRRDAVPAMQTDLERIAGELMVDLSLAPAD